jgi:hypothetical protein
VLQLQREVAALRRENATLKAQNDSMRNGMRRCVTCEYRLDFKARQGSAPVLNETETQTGQS